MRARGVIGTAFLLTVVGQIAFYAGIVWVIVRIIWPWLAGILRANGLKGV